MASKHTITYADEIFIGRGFFAPMVSEHGKPGIPIRGLTKVNFGAVETLDADGIVASATSTELPNAETVTYTTADDGTSPFDNAATPAPADVVMADGASYSVWTLDVARNVTAAVGHASAVVAMTVLVTGFDQWGQRMSELLSLTAGGTSKTAAGKKAFKHILSISITAATNAESNTGFNLGWGDVLGMPYRIDGASDVLSAFCDGTMELASCTVVAADATDPATTTTGDPRGTIDFSTASNGTRVYAAWVHVADPNDTDGLRGVAQA